MDKIKFLKPVELSSLSVGSTALNVKILKALIDTLETVEGKYVIKDNPLINSALGGFSGINFTSNGQTFNSITVNSEYDSEYGDYYIYYYDNILISGNPSTTGFNYSYDTIDFGEQPQVILKSEKEWLSQVYKKILPQIAFYALGERQADEGITWEEYLSTNSVDDGSAEFFIEEGYLMVNRYGTDGSTSNVQYNGDIVRSEDVIIADGYYN